MNSVEPILSVNRKLSYQNKLAAKELGPPRPDLLIEKVTKTIKQDYKRTFNKEVYNKHKWLFGCNVRNALYCFPLGPHYRHMSFKSRQDVLRNQYFFSCTCDACSSPKHDFQERFSALLCSKCSGPLVPKEDSNISARETGISIGLCTCNDCGHTQDSQKLVELAFKAEALYEQGLGKLKEEKLKEAITDFKACWEVQKKYLYKHNHQLCMCMDQIAKCYAILGDYEKSVEYLEHNLSAIEERFGCHSVELGNELQKLSDVMMQDLLKRGTREKQQKAKDCIKKAKAILEMHYGPWNSGLQEIEQKEKLLLQLISKNT